MNKLSVEYLHMPQQLKRKQGQQVLTLSDSFSAGLQLNLSHY
jgi:hypothetical protein